MWRREKMRVAVLPPALLPRAACAWPALQKGKSREGQGIQDQPRSWRALLLTIPRGSSAVGWKALVEALWAGRQGLISLEAPGLPIAAGLGGNRGDLDSGGGETHSAEQSPGQGAQRPISCRKGPRGFSCEGGAGEAALP